MRFIISNAAGDGVISAVDVFAASGDGLIAAGEVCHAHAASCR